MDMGMGGEVPGPRVEDAHHADLPAEGGRIQREGLQGGRGGLTKQVGQTALRRTDYRAPCLGQRQGAQQVRDGQEECSVLCQLARGRFMLARGTMPVLTGMIYSQRRAMRLFESLLVDWATNPSTCFRRLGDAQTGIHP